MLAQEQARALVRRFASEARLCERESSWPSFHDAQRRRTARRSSSPRKIQKGTRDQILGVSVRPDRKARQGACLPGVCAERKKFHLIPQRCFSCLVRGGMCSIVRKRALYHWFSFVVYQHHGSCLLPLESAFCSICLISPWQCC